ncbi:ATP-binding cassette domain-containing protein [Pseudonocardia ailaonensis]|uniref:ATP-binding cassette domain-containing protein n=1 Tax=Pseudonocardia ailaonensis TaxID=367279 RepID=A0ABN2NP45_9PSEU
MSTAMAPPDAALAAVDLVKTYRGGVRALDGLSVSAAPGTIVALLGRNGAGKSTTVKILATLARPDSGAAFVAGVDVVRDPDAVRRAIGLVSQKASSDPMATGRENLELAARIQGLSRRDARARAGDLLDRFDLADAGDRRASTYSGGMGRRLDVAIGLVHRPRVLFLDEPTTGLDPQVRAAMWAEIARLATDEQVTVLLTTHYLDEADRLADRVAIVDAGRIVVEGTPDELKSSLRGDTVALDVEAPSRALAALERVPGLRDTVADGRRIRARIDGERTVPSLLTALDRAGVAALSITVARPSLDDVYLAHVGREIAA